MECEKIKYFHDGDQLIAFNVRTLKVFRFKSELKRLLPVLLPERYTPEQKKAYLKMTDTIENDGFREYMRFLAYDEPNDGSVAGIDTLTISFPTVHKCNLQCRYCYADSGENFTENTKFMSESVIDDILRFSLTKLAPECKFIQISLVSGGEPLMNLDIMRNVDKMISKYRSDVDRKIFIASNLTLLNDKHIELFDELQPQIAVSIDGDREVHDAMRVYKDGRGTYDDVVRNFRRLKKECNIAKTKMPMVMSVITDKNLDLISVIDHHLALGASSVQMKVARGDVSKHTISKENVGEFIAAYSKLADSLKDRFSNNDTKALMAIMNGNDTLGKLLKNVMLLRAEKFRCGAGKDRFSFTATGDIYPCDNFVGMNKYLIGNIYSDDQQKGGYNFFSINVDTSEKCRRCWAKYLCSGDCYFNAMTRTGSLSNQDEYMCKFYRALCETALRLVSSLEEIDRDRYKMLKRLVSIRENNNYIH